MTDVRINFNTTFVAVIKADATLKAKYPNSDVGLKGIIGERLLKLRGEVAGIETQKKDPALIESATALYRSDLKARDLKNATKSVHPPPLTSIFGIALQELLTEVNFPASFDDLQESSRNAVGVLEARS